MFSLPEKPLPQPSGITCHVRLRVFFKQVVRHRWVAPTSSTPSPDWYPAERFRRVKLVELSGSVQRGRGGHGPPRGRIRRLAGSQRDRSARGRACSSPTPPYARRRVASACAPERIGTKEGVRSKSQTGIMVGYAAGPGDLGVRERGRRVYPRSRSLRAPASPLAVTRSRVPMGSQVKWWACRACYRKRIDTEP